MIGQTSGPPVGELEAPAERHLHRLLALHGWRWKWIWIHPAGIHHCEEATADYLSLIGSLFFQVQLRFNRIHVRLTPRVA
jgi:hypothetical protein